MHAQCTSSDVKGGGGRAEVDSFIGSVTLAPERVSAGPFVGFDEFVADKAITYIPLTLDFQLRVDPAALAAPAVQPPMSPRPFTPYYLDAASWSRVLSEILYSG